MTRARRLRSGMAAAACVLGLAAPATATAGPDVPDGEMGPLKLVSKGGRHAQYPSISADGRYLTYTTKKIGPTGEQPNGRWQVVRYDRTTRDHELVSVTSAGDPGSGHSSRAVLSADGHLVAFVTEAGDLLPGAPDLDVEVVVVRDMTTGAVELLSRTPDGEPPDEDSWGVNLSAEGSVATFVTRSTDITGTPGATLVDLGTGVATVVTIPAGDDQVVPDEVWLSGDGRWVAFESDNPEIVPGDDNDATDVFVLHLGTGELTLVSRAADGTVANGGSHYGIGFREQHTLPKPVLSADGSKVGFSSRATDLAGAAIDDAGTWDGDEGFVFDAGTGRSEVITVLPDGSLSDDLNREVSISPDGRYAAVRSQAFLAGGGGGLGLKVFLRDLERGVTRAVSDDRNAANPAIGGAAGRPYVAMVSSSRMLPEDQDGLAADIYLRRVW